jgi:PilZ domain-containing protein
MSNESTNQSFGEKGQYAERRENPRYTFIATAEIIEPSTDTHISGRVSEISRKGCYIDVLNTLPKGTPIRVRITTDGGVFQSAGHIIYVQERMGIGVAFEDTAADQDKLLEGWLNVLR